MVQHTRINEGSKGHLEDGVELTYNEAAAILTICFRLTSDYAVRIKATQGGPSWKVSRKKLSSNWNTMWQS